MALPATDTFTGTNGTALPTYSANWAANAGTIQINTNAYVAASAGNECGCRWTADAFNNDQYSQATLTAKDGTSNSEVGVGVRHAAAGTATYYGYYQEGLSSGACFKNVGGTWTQLGAAFGSAGAGTLLRLEVSGTTLTVYHAGVSQGTRTDSSIASGVAGVVAWGSATGTRCDGWEGGNLSAGTAVKRNNLMLLGVGRG